MDARTKTIIHGFWLVIRILYAAELALILSIILPLCFGAADFAKLTFFLLLKMWFAQVRNRLDIERSDFIFANARKRNRKDFSYAAIVPGDDDDG